jgi:hypothetical protein
VFVLPKEKNASAVATPKGNPYFIKQTNTRETTP